MIKSNFDGNYPFDPVRTFDFTKFVPNGVTIYYGIGHLDPTGDTNKKVKLHLETPNMLYIYDSAYDASRFDLVYHLCPYTCAYLNELHSTNKFKPIFFPIEDIRIENTRVFDVFYTGSRIPGLHVFEMIERSIQRRIGTQFDQMKAYMSSPTLEGYYKKMELWSKTKICIAHNILLSKHHFPNYYSNQLTQKHLPWDSHSGVTPQLKSRVFEGALMGCILLVYKDQYKTIERYFTENVDFIYFENEQDLNNKIDTILANYDAYKHIGLNAQAKVRNNYLTQHFVDEIKRELQIG
jgi:hypothetical protein